MRVSWKVESLKLLTAYSLPGTEIDEQGNIRHQPSDIRLLKWVFWILVAIIVLILLVRVKH